MHATTTQEKIKTGGLCHLAIDVSDMDRSLKFYMDMFDMNIIHRTDHFIHVQTAGAKDNIFLFKADGPVSPKAGGMTHMHFGFRIDDKNFEKALEYIKRNNIKVHPNPARGTGRFIYIEDPDGYVIQLEPGDCD